MRRKLRNPVAAMRTDLEAAAVSLPHAFADRDKAFYLAADDSREDEPRPERHTAWTEALWQAVAPYTDGAYASFLEDAGEGRVRSAYSPATYTSSASAPTRHRRASRRPRPLRSPPAASPSSPSTRKIRLAASATPPCPSNDATSEGRPVRFSRGRCRHS
jgi:hypothetical protein